MLGKRRDAKRRGFVNMVQGQEFWEQKLSILVVQACFLPSSGLVPSAVLIVAKKCPS